MKKLLILLLSLLLVLSACGGETPESGNTDSPADTQILLAEQLAGFAGQNQYREHQHVTDVVVALPTEGGSILPLLEAQLGELAYYGSKDLSEQLVGIVFEDEYTDTQTPDSYVLLADQRQLDAEDGFGSYPYQLLYNKTALEHVDRPAILLDTEELTYIPPATAAGYSKIKLTILLDGTNLWYSLQQKQAEYQQTADEMTRQYTLNKNGMLDILNDTRAAEPETWASNPEVLAMCQGNARFAEYVMYCAAAEWLGELAAAIEAAPAEQWPGIIDAYAKQQSIDNKLVVLGEEQYALADRYHTYKMMAEYDLELFAAEIGALEQQYGEDYKQSLEYAAILAQAPDLRALEKLQQEIGWYSRQMELLPQYAQLEDKLEELMWAAANLEYDYAGQLWQARLAHGEAQNIQLAYNGENADIQANLAADVAAAQAEIDRITAEQDAALAKAHAAIHDRQLYLARTADDALLMPYLLNLAARIGEINTQPVENSTVLGELDGFTIIKINAAQVKAIDEARFVYGTHDENAYKNMTLDQLGEYVGGECTICKDTASHSFQGYRYCDKHYVEAIAWAINNIADKN